MVSPCSPWVSSCLKSEMPTEVLIAIFIEQKKLKLTEKELGEEREDWLKDQGLKGVLKPTKPK